MSSYLMNRTNDNGFGFGQDRIVIAGRRGASAVATVRHLALWHQLWSLACQWVAMKRSPKQVVTSAVRSRVVTTTSRRRVADTSPRRADVGTPGQLS